MIKLFVTDIDGCLAEPYEPYDLEALSAVGNSFAPANADEEVLRTVDYVTDGSVLDGTLEAYRRCLDWNELERGQ